MAASFYITDGSNTVYFIGGSSELQLRTGGWNTESISEEFTWETIELISDNTDATVRTEKKKLDLLIYKARLYAKNSLSSEEVWLYENADGESAKRALVVDGSTEILSDEIYSPLMGIDSIKLVAALKRKVWENTSYTSVNTTGLSVTGGTWVIGNDAGTDDQRIERGNFYAKTAAKQRYWVGIRPIYAGTGDFDPLWECEDGTNNADASDVGDGTASGGNKVQISFSGTPTLAERFTISVDDVVGAGDETHFVGRYQVLARCKVDAGSTQVRVQLRTGLFYLLEAETIVQDTIIDGQTSWDLVELGEVQFPATGLQGLGSDLESTSLMIWAERLSGAGTLDMDALILIPSEHLFTCSATSLVVDEGPEVYTTPLDKRYAVGRAAGRLGNVDYHAPPTWQYPIGGGIMVVAAAEETSHSLTGTLDPTLYLVPRWQSYRA